MKISVIIPVYNVAAYLQACVQSLLAQSHQDLEIILVDDGSTDNSGALCDSLAAQDPRVRAVHQANQGLSGARNTGLRHATGDYLAFLDGDDVYLLTDGLAQLVQALQQAAKPIDMLLFQCVDVYPTYQATRKAYDLDYLAAHHADEVFEYLVRQQCLNMSACFQLLRREFLLQHNLFFEVGLLSEDVDWTLRVWREVKQVDAVNIPLYGYQHREGSITTTYTIRNLRSYNSIFRKFKTQYAQEQKNLTDDAKRYWSTTFGYLAQMYTSCLYLYHAIAKPYRHEARQILREHHDLLQYSISHKSGRAVLLHRFLGFYGMLFVFALYGSVKRRHHV